MFGDVYGGLCARVAPDQTLPSYGFGIGALGGSGCVWAAALSALVPQGCLGGCLGAKRVGISGPRGPCKKSYSGVPRALETAESRPRRYQRQAQRPRIPKRDPMSGVGSEGELQCGVEPKARERERVISSEASAKVLGSEVRSNTRLLLGAHHRALAAHARAAKQSARCT